MALDIRDFFSTTASPGRMGAENSPGSSPNADIRASLGGGGERGVWEGAGGKSG